MLGFYKPAVSKKNPKCVNAVGKDYCDRGGFGVFFKTVYLVPKNASLFPYVYL